MTRHRRVLPGPQVVFCEVSRAGDRLQAQYPARIAYLRFSFGIRQAPRGQGQTVPQPAAVKATGVNQALLTTTPRSTPAGSPPRYAPDGFCRYVNYMPSREFEAIGQ